MRLLTNKYVKLHRCHLRQDDACSGGDRREATVSYNHIEGGGAGEMGKVIKLVHAIQRVLDDKVRHHQLQRSPSDGVYSCDSERNQLFNGESNRAE